LKKIVLCPYLCIQFDAAKIQAPTGHVNSQFWLYGIANYGYIIPVPISIFNNYASNEQIFQ